MFPHLLMLDQRLSPSEIRHKGQNIRSSQGFQPWFLAQRPCRGCSDGCGLWAVGQVSVQVSEGPPCTLHSPVTVISAFTYQTILVRPTPFPLEAMIQSKPTTMDCGSGPSPT